MNVFEARNEIISCMDQVEIEYGLNTQVLSKDTPGFDTWGLYKIFTPTQDGIFFMTWKNEETGELKHFQIVVTETTLVPGPSYGWYDQEDGGGKE